MVVEPVFKHTSLWFWWRGPPAINGKTEQWNGSSWTEVNNLNTARYQLTGANKEIL